MDATKKTFRFACWSKEERIMYFERGHEYLLGNYLGV